MKNITWLQYIRSSSLNIIQLDSAEAYKSRTFIRRVGLGPGGVVYIMDTTGRPRPKGVPYSDWRYIKGLGFHELKYRKGLGKLSFSY